MTRPKSFTTVKILRFVTLFIAMTAATEGQCLNAQSSTATLQRRGLVDRVAVQEEDRMFPIGDVVEVMAEQPLEWRSHPSERLLPTLDAARLVAPLSDLSADTPVSRLPSSRLTDHSTPEGERGTVAPVQVRNRAGVPWIVAGAALVLGGAIVGHDVGTVLMVGGVLTTSYGLFIYF